MAYVLHFLLFVFVSPCLSLSLNSDTSFVSVFFFFVSGQTLYIKRNDGDGLQIQLKMFTKNKTHLKGFHK